MLIAAMPRNDSCLSEGKTLPCNSYSFLSTLRTGPHVWLPSLYPLFSFHAPQNRNSRRSKPPPSVSLRTNTILGLIELNRSSSTTPSRTKSIRPFALRFSCSHSSKRESSSFKKPYRIEFESIIFLSCLVAIDPLSSSSRRAVLATTGTVRMLGAPAADQRGNVAEFASAILALIRSRFAAIVCDVLALA